MLFAPSSEDIDGSESDLGKTADIVLADEQASDRGRVNGEDQEGVSARLTLDIVDQDYGDEDELEAAETEQQKLDQNDVEKAPNVSFWNQLFKLL